MSLAFFLLAILCLITIPYAINGQTSFSNCTEYELEALTDFKRGLNDPENRLVTWQGSNCCQWRGIRCDNETGAVVAIDIHNPYPVSSDSSGRYGFWNLSGELRPSLTRLESLRYLDLSLNTFQDIPIPGFLGSLENLQYLNLSKAGFAGGIPVSLGNLSQLEYLDVSSEFSGLSSDSLDWLASLVSLKHLQMNNVDLSLVGTNWDDVFQKLLNLTELHLSMCRLTGPISSFNLVNLTSLAVIDLSFNFFNSRFPDWFVNVSSLLHVDLSNCELYGRIPLGFSEIPGLQYLNLAGNYNLSASCPQLFHGSWRKIKYLNFASNRLHGKLPSSIGNMTSLIYLDLSINNAEGGVPSSIGKLCNLKSIDISGNNLTGSLPEFLEGTENCVPNSPLPNLMYIRLSNNQLQGTLPGWLGQLRNLIELNLGYNLFRGTIPVSLGNLKNLTQIGLQGNELNGTLPESFGQLSELSILDVSSNQLSGIISVVHFSRLSKLEILHLSSNSFILNVSSDWIPPFQVRNLDMHSCHVGPVFPSWLESQKGVRFLDLSNTSISDSIPNWFWDISGNLSLLNVSLNQLRGQIPNPFNVAPFADVDLSSNMFEGPIPLPNFEIELLDLSNNRFTGSIPRNISAIMPNLIFLSLSSNQITNEIPISIGDMASLLVIDLSRNNITGNVPVSMGNCSLLKALDLGYNNLVGGIPPSLGQLSQLVSLHMNDNRLGGKIPQSFRNLSSLETLDLGNNNLSGKISIFNEVGFADLRILALRSNSFSGEIPSEISNLKSLQVLDLAENNFTGRIPASLGDLTAMAREQNVIHYLLYGNYRGTYYEESLTINTKGQSQTFKKTLSLVVSLDLSSNALHGDFPSHLTKLSGLVVLNLSRNQINGQIPANISSLNQLASLDLSINNLSGEIPPSISSLSFLGYLNLSNNNLSGMIPYRSQIATFEASSFGGNPNLCGDPLDVTCQDEDSDKGGSNIEDGNGDGFIDKWFYLFVGLGYAAGILVPMFVLAVRKPWRNAYYVFMDRIVDR